MTPRLVLVGAVVICALIGVTFALAPGGLAQLERLTVEEEALQADVERRTKENERLAKDIELLRGDSDASKNALEKKAREELGFIGKGEVVVTLEPEAGR